MFLKDKDQCNLTDPENRLMRKNKRSGDLEAYNAQAIVDADEDTPTVKKLVLSKRPESMLWFQFMFLLGGLEKVENEWNLVALAYNVKRLYSREMG